MTKVEVSQLVSVLEATVPPADHDGRLNVGLLAKSLFEVRVVIWSGPTPT